jgi:hypothetical protein
MRQIIDAVFSPQERQARLAAMGNPVVEEIGTTPTLYVLRFRGQKIGVGFTLDVAIADAESNINNYIQRQGRKYAQKVTQKQAARKAG